MEQLAYTLERWKNGTLPETIALRTRRIYDRLAFVYPVSTYLFHARANRCALEMSGIRNGMDVLEVATGSGEMFRRIVRANRNGATVGIDLSPRMAARTLRRVRREFPSSATQCHAVDARNLPFPDGSFDAVVCCYMLELLSSDDIRLTVREFGRVLRPRGTLTIVLIAQDGNVFNGAYRMAGALAPAFWGRQVDRDVPSILAAVRFRIDGDRPVRQAFYRSRVLVASKTRSG